jgi:hypothetical protein
LALAACTQHTTPYQLTYQFEDSNLYRVESKYSLDHQLTKKHDSTVFSDKQEGLYVKTAFLVRVEKQKTEMLHVYFTIQNISIHDQAGNFRLEMGPDNGQISWYGQEQSMAEYLGQEGFEQYQQYMSQPLAMLMITPLGVQVQDPKASQGHFNYAFIQLLGKNRVLGKIVMKSLKIPPVLMTIFNNEPAFVGKKWSYQGPYTQRFTKWDNPLTTLFQVTAVKQDVCTVIFDSELKFSGEELTELGKQFGLEEFENVVFERSHFTVNGTVDYQAVLGRPESGSMLIQKQYGMATGEENWELTEKEMYEFTMTAEPAVGKKETPKY